MNYKPFSKRTDLDGSGCTLHALQHTFASALLDRDAHMEKVQMLMGHSSIKQMIDTYFHLMRNTGRNIVESLDETLDYI